MANVMSFRETFPQRDGTVTVENNFNREYTRSFVLEVDDSTAAPNTIIPLAQTVGVPVVMDMYQGADGSVDFGSFCSSVSAKPYGAPWIWQIDCKFTGNIDLSNPSGDALLMPPVLKWGNKSASKPVEFAYNFSTVITAQITAQIAAAQAAVDAAQAIYDVANVAYYLTLSQYVSSLDGADVAGSVATTLAANNVAQVNVNAAAATLATAAQALAVLQSYSGLGRGFGPVLNSAGDPYNPPLTIEQGWLTLSISRNFARYDPILARSFVNAVNDDAWLGFQPGEVVCRAYDGQSVYEKGRIYWAVSANFEIKTNTGETPNDAWAAKVLDKGFQCYYLLPNGSKLSQKRAAVDLLGKVLPSGTLLDGTGGPLVKGAKPVFNTHYIYQRATFANLGLP